MSSPMLRILAVVIALCLLLLAALLIGQRWIGSQTFGTGECRPSPDTRYMACVHSYTKDSFWTGKTRHWFEFRLTGPDLDDTLTTSPIAGPYFGSRSNHQVVFWQPDSRAVRFVFPNATLRIGTDPKAAAAASAAMGAP